MPPYFFGARRTRIPGAVWTSPSRYQGYDWLHVRAGGRPDHQAGRHVCMEFLWRQGQALGAGRRLVSDRADRHSGEPPMARGRQPEAHRRARRRRVGREFVLLRRAEVRDSTKTG